LQSYFRDSFWEKYKQLLLYAQKQTDRAFEHFALDLAYPSLRFKCKNQQRACYAIRINKKGYRALGYLIDGDMYWYWIGGDHNEYEREIRK
jgi:hypothetical protein